MKKSLIKITTATVFTFVSFTALAQQAADKKPEINESKQAIEIMLPEPSTTHANHATCQANIICGVLLKLARGVGIFGWLFF